jgi:uncharacterized protein YbcC (UPF0753/DUF2309 family)
MHTMNNHFDLSECLHQLAHYLPAQAPLKDFVHHNTLHSFQELPFAEAITSASDLFGYRVLLDLNTYRHLYLNGRIRHDVLQQVIRRRKPTEPEQWMEAMINERFPPAAGPRIGQLRAGWKRYYKADIDSMVHPLLFRTICSYLDQGIAIWRFPEQQQSFLEAIKTLETNGLVSFFRKKRARQLLLQGPSDTVSLLKLLIGQQQWFTQYLFDQQFAHAGWSGIVAAVERQPTYLRDERRISLEELIRFELLLEIDALDELFGTSWPPLAQRLQAPPTPLFDPVQPTKLDEVLLLWQEAFEWSYYDQVLAGLQQEKPAAHNMPNRSFQALFCMDDRECSLRRYLENTDPACETFGTPGFFGVEFYYRPAHAKFNTKLCPAPVQPHHLIEASDEGPAHQKDPFFNKHAHSFHSGWFIAQTLGIWSAFKLFINIFKPSISPATVLSVRHMHPQARLSVENQGKQLDGLQVGFTVAEMADRVEAVLKSIGLVHNFAPLIYIVGHGASSANNPHYAAYDCGACCGRPGSVNARVFSIMANHEAVRKLLHARGIHIPADTHFVGALHDTTRDEIFFYDEAQIPPALAQDHQKNQTAFSIALQLNAVERARRFESINLNQSAKRVHALVKRRSLSLFEPRPELNHATNAVAIIGRRQLTRGIFLDRRAFLNSYDYEVDPQGDYLYNILKAVAPVAGGINLEYYFSHTDNQKLGAGTKLPHNVMGLFGVANGIDGDLRPGLPAQMVEVHEPLRLLVVVERDAPTVLQVIQRDAQTWEWFHHQWVYLVCIDPQSKALHYFDGEQFVPYSPQSGSIPVATNLDQLLTKERGNLPVMLLDQNQP